MNIKKLLLSALLLSTTVFAYAEDTTDYIKIDDCTIVAGVDNNNEGIVNISLYNEYEWCALQFDLYLPKGVEIGLYNNVPYIARTNRLKYEWGLDTENFNLEYNEQSEGVYRIVAFNTKNQPIQDSSNKAIIRIRLIASDQANTGEYTASIKNVILANSKTSTGTSTVVGADADDTEATFKIQINAPIGAGGYGTFSWPRDVDFSADTNVEAIYVPAGTPSNGWLKLTSIGKQVPKNTGVLIKGKASTTVNPATTATEVAPVTSDFGNTSMGTYTAGANVYALKTVEGKAGLHKVNSGVVIPKYKAYLISPSGAKYFSFGDTATNIDTMDMTEEDGDIYTLGGQKVQKTTMKGVYIKNGKKVVVK